MSKPKFRFGLRSQGLSQAEQPSNGDFSKLNDTGLKKCFGYWRYIDKVPAGCLILWPSSLPHGNKSANKTCQEKGRYGLYICYLPKEIETTDEHNHTERQKREAINGGYSYPHWPLYLGRPCDRKRGSHYSNRGSDATKVLYNDTNRPVFEDGLRRKIFKYL